VGAIDATPFDAVIVSGDARQGRATTAIREVDQAGIDCPLGWPAAFADLVTAPRAGRLRPVAERGMLGGRVTHDRG
jgi:hypothetical protein